MQNMKGLVSRTILSEESFAPVMKKAQEHRRATQVCIDYFQQINRLYETYTSQEKWALSSELDKGLNNGFYKSIVNLLKIIHKLGVELTENTNGSFKQLTSLCNTIFHQFSKFILNFQQTLRQYQASEQIIFEMIKKYFRTHKVMLNSIDHYKSTFTDVNIIYNMDEKHKRFKTCENNYKTVKEQYEILVEKVSKLSAKKFEIIQLCSNIDNQFVKVAQIIGTKIISETKNFFAYFCKCNKQMLASFATEKFSLEAQKISTFFIDVQYENNNQVFMDGTQIKYNQLNIPNIFIYYEYIRQEYLESYNLEMMKYMHKVEEATEKRKVTNKLYYDCISQFYRNLEKLFNPVIKQILGHFEKMKKKLGEVFSYRLVSFIKSVNSIFELDSGLNEKMLKRIYPKLTQIQSLINEQNKLLKLFGDQLKTNIEKFIGKKQIKKIKQDQFTEQSNIGNTGLFRKQIAQKSDFIRHLIEGFQDKMLKNHQKIGSLYLQIVGDHYVSINQFYSFCCEYRNLYFGEQEFKTNFLKYQSDINALLEKERQFLGQLPIMSLKNSKEKITFDGQFSKIEDFKKIKKPKTIQQKPEDLYIDGALVEGKLNEDGTQIEKVQNQQKNNQFPPQRQTIGKSTTTAQRQTLLSVEDKQVKNAEFLAGKITFKQNQQLLKSFSCALVDKIVLQGRIYITSQRICFHSKFNSGNVFFGGTFIQIPKNDIKKVQKRKNAFFLDNMISITTINGEVSFTSFFSRDQAYDLICKIFQINLDDQVYQYTQKQETIGLPNFLIELQEDDDIKKSEQPDRQQQIAKLLANFNYNNAVKSQFEREGFNALKIFKVFYQVSEINIGRKTYPCFLEYVKGLLNHKDIDIGEFDPPLSEIINQSNLKCNSPLKTCRKMKATIPVSAAGVPFMPKTAKSEEQHIFYFISKHKWILQTTIKTQGAPYTDTFIVQLKTTVQSTEQGKSTISMGYFVNFVKSTMMKSVIQSKTQQQTVSASRVHVEQIKRYYIQLEKSLNKKVASDPLAQIKQELNSKDKQLQEISEQRDKMKQELISLRSSKNIGKYILLGSLILNLLLFLVLIR